MKADSMAAWQECIGRQEWLPRMGNGVNDHAGVPA
jgi:hypothetical protein